MQIEILKDKPDSPWKVIGEAFRWRFDPRFKWSRTIWQWVFWLLLINFIAQLVNVQCLKAAYHVPLPKIKTTSDYLLSVLIQSPMTILASTLIWSLDLGFTQLALCQIRGIQRAESKLASYLHRFWQFLPAAILTHIGATITLLLIFKIVGNYTRLVSMLIHPVFGAFLLYVLPLMSDRKMKIKESVSLSVMATKGWPVACIGVYWCLQMVTTLGIAACYIPASSRLGSSLNIVAFLSIVGALWLSPIPFIGVAILYRKQFGDPEPAAPPVMVEPS